MVETVRGGTAVVPPRILHAGGETRATKPLVESISSLLLVLKPRPVSEALIVGQQLDRKRSNAKMQMQQQLAKPSFQEWAEVLTQCQPRKVKTLNPKVAKVARRTTKLIFKQDYIDAISSCGDARRADLAQELLHQMIEAGWEADEVAFREVIRACIRSGERKRALALFDLMRKNIEPTEYIYDMAMRACYLDREWERALSIFDEMRKTIKPTALSFSSAIRACFAGEEWTRALALVDEMRQADVEMQHVHFCTALTAYHKTGDWQGALELLEEMQRIGLTPDVHCFTAAISACAFGQQSRRALELFEEMGRLGVNPNEATFTKAISACQKCKDWNLTLEMFANAGRWMQKSDMMPNEVRFNEVISACERGGEWMRALEIFDGMRKNGVDLDEMSYNAALSACGHALEWKRSVELLEEMQRAGVKPSSIIFNAAIKACSKSKEAEVAMKLFGELDTSPSVAIEPATFNAILDALTSPSDEPAALPTSMSAVGNFASLPHQARAQAIWKRALERRTFRKFVQSQPLELQQLDMHGLSEGAAETALRWWLGEVLQADSAHGRCLLGAASSKRFDVMEVIVGDKSSPFCPKHQRGDMRKRIIAVLQELGVPLLGGSLHVDTGSLHVDTGKWLAQIESGRNARVSGGGWDESSQKWEVVGRYWEDVGVKERVSGEASENAKAVEAVQNELDSVTAAVRGARKIENVHEALEAFLVRDEDPFRFVFR